MVGNGWSLPWTFRCVLVLSIFHILPCLLLSVSGPLPAGQTDTLAAAVVSSVQLLPVVKPAVEVSLPDW